MTTPQGELAEQAVGAFTIAAPLTTQPARPPAFREPDEKWELPNGFAWVFYGDGNQGITRPVIMADGFNLGKSDLRWLAEGLDADYPLMTQLRQRGRDVILLGFEERSASILDNAEAAIVAIRRTLAEQLGDAPLTVGGFSMGGLVTRYALARLEMQRKDHRTRLYFSWDSPHRGATIPVGLQAFSHFIPFANDFARQMDSPAARQLLWRHYDPKTKKIGVAPERTEFLRKLDEVGGWPRIPRLIALANGRGDGIGLPDVKPGDVAYELKKLYRGSKFYVQAQGAGAKSAELFRLVPPGKQEVTTDGFPELDGAPGGTLHTYRILADTLKDTAGLKHEDICFVPSVSAVAIRDIEKQDDLYAKVDDLSPDESDVDDFICSSTTTAHTAITEELGSWLLERLPD
ncbi:esterase/lipase family protein [Kitasatospora sp. NPDC058190]|uniref:esterase/lipase family protein n=1 Tax=Kitasatospora sp. NPDC058190 TaxID=3346371 RepID=UPI0036DCA052